MNRAEFDKAVEDLLKRVNELRFDDYYGGKSIVRDFELLAHQHIEYINQFTTEHTYAIEADFENMKKYKSSSRKWQHFNSAVNGLKSDVASMRMNRVPE
jgi:hypothetical protein